MDFFKKYSEEDLTFMEKKVQEIFKAYGFSDENIKLLEGYAEGHDLMIVYDKADNEIKLEDTQEADSFWAVGIQDIIYWISDASEDILKCEKEEDEPNEEKIRDLKKDAVVLAELLSKVKAATKKGEKI